MKKKILLVLTLFLFIPFVKAESTIPFFESGTFIFNKDGENYLQLSAYGSTGARNINLFKDDVKVYNQYKEITQKQYDELIAYLNEAEKLENTDHFAASKKIEEFKQKALEIGFDDSKWIEIENYKYDGDNRIYKLLKHDKFMYLEWIKIETDDFGDGDISKYYSAAIFKDSSSINLDIQTEQNNSGEDNVLIETENKTDTNVDVEIKDETTETVKKEDTTKEKNPKTGIVNDYRFYIGLVVISSLSYMVFRKVKRIV